MMWKDDDKWIFGVVLGLTLFAGMLLGRAITAQTPAPLAPNEIILDMANDDTLRGVINRLLRMGNFPAIILPVPPKELNEARDLCGKINRPIGIVYFNNRAKLICAAPLDELIADALARLRWCESVKRIVGRIEGTLLYCVKPTAPADEPYNLPENMI